MLSDMLLEGKVAIITGAGSGIGRSSALRFAAEGAAVVVADVRGDRARKVTDMVLANGGRAMSCEADVGDSAQFVNDERQRYTRGGLYLFR